MFNVKEFYKEIVKTYEKNHPIFWEHMKNKIAQEVEFEYYFYSLPSDIPKVVRDYFEEHRKIFESDFNYLVNDFANEVSLLFLGYVVDGFYEYMVEEELEEKLLEPKQLLWDMAT